jgi:hypothetical protein
MQWGIVKKQGNKKTSLERRLVTAKISVKKLRKLIRILMGQVNESRERGRRGGKAQRPTPAPAPDSRAEVPPLRNPHLAIRHRVRLRVARIGTTEGQEDEAEPNQRTRRLGIK